MQQVEPQVYLIGETKLISTDGSFADLPKYLEEVGAPDWTSNGPTDGEQLSEFYGRQCYRSFKPLLNPNVTRVRKDNAKYLGHIFKVGHGSITEHVQLNFVFHNVSRVFTHELVRHRVGVAISQESLRYVRLQNLKAWIPPCFEADPVLKAKFIETFEYLEKVQLELGDYLKLDEMKNFGKKKEFTSAMRRLAPIGLATSIGWSANIRTLRHVIEMRTDPAAEVEIRLVFDEVAKILQNRYPNFFRDYERVEVDGCGHWQTKNRKV